jgi:hypothetical protein
MRNVPGIVVSGRKGVSLRHRFFYGTKGTDWVEKDYYMNSRIIINGIYF